jgi:hypothetical protein
MLAWSYNEIEIIRTNTTTFPDHTYPEYVKGLPQGLSILLDDPKIRHLLDETDNDVAL